MRGMDAITGKTIEGDAHLRQSIANILTTPIGTRVMRRDYGSRLFDLVDAPFNAATKLRLFGAIATALLRWETRFRLTRIEIAAGEARGSFVIDLEGERTDQPKPTPARFTVPLRLANGALTFA